MSSLKEYGKRSLLDVIASNRTEGGKEEMEKYEERAKPPSGFVRSLQDPRTKTIGGFPQTLRLHQLAQRLGMIFDQVLRTAV